MAKNGLTREQARELYDDMHKAMSQILKNNPEGAPKPKTGKAASTASSARPSTSSISQKPAGFSIKSPPSSYRSNNAPMNGRLLAAMTVITMAGTNIMLSGYEAFSIGKVQTAEATYVQQAPAREKISGNFSKEEMTVLTELDTRRAELEERSKKLDDQERNLQSKDREFASRLSEIRELTGKLKIEREKTDKKQDDQLAQLANVYGSMNPPEAAALMEQLDVTTALALIKKMPEKKIGQILSLMNAERALTITRMLTN